MIFPVNIRAQLTKNGCRNDLFVQMLYAIAAMNDAMGIMPIKVALMASCAPNAFTYIVLEGSTIYCHSQTNKRKHETVSAHNGFGSQ